MSTPGKRTRGPEHTGRIQKRKEVKRRRVLLGKLNNESNVVPRF